MINNFTKETKKTIVKNKVKKAASSAKKFGILAAGLALATVVVVAAKKSTKKIKTNNLSNKKGGKPKGYIDVEMLDEEPDTLALEHKGTNVVRTTDGTLELQGAN